MLEEEIDFEGLSELLKGSDQIKKNLRCEKITIKRNQEENGNENDSYFS
ncbi:MAG: hypothetical protein ACLVIS_00685 [Dorea longicatena]